MNYEKKIPDILISISILILGNYLILPFINYSYPFLFEWLIYFFKSFFDFYYSQVYLNTGYIFSLYFILMLYFFIHVGKILKNELKDPELVDNEKDPELYEKLKNEYDQEKIFGVFFSKPKNRVQYSIIFLVSCFLSISSMFVSVGYSTNLKMQESFIIIKP